MLGRKAHMENREQLREQIMLGWLGGRPDGKCRGDFQTVNIPALLDAPTTHGLAMDLKVEFDCSEYLLWSYMSGSDPITRSRLKLARILALAGASRPLFFTSPRHVRWEHRRLTRWFNYSLIGDCSLRRYSYTCSADGQNWTYNIGRGLCLKLRSKQGLFWGAHLEF